MKRKSPSRGDVGANPAREDLRSLLLISVINTPLNNAYQVNSMYNIVMVTEFNSVHKHSESPLHWSGRESETISDYLEGSHDLSNSGYRIMKREPKKWTKLYYTIIPPVWRSSSRR